MQRPLMNPNFQFEQPPRPRDWKIVFRIARKVMRWTARALLFDVRPRFRKPRVIMEEGSPWQRCVRGVFYRLACVPVLVAATAAILVFAITHPRVAMSDRDPISAGVYRGVRVTGSRGIKDDLVNAGAVWEDAAVVVDRHFVSSRKPDDLPDFCRAILGVLTKAAR